MKRILVAEDDSDLGMILEARLKTNGYEIYRASDGIEALVKTRELKPDLILLDVLMPTMNGYEFIQEIKWEEEVNGIPILVITGRTEIEKEFASSRIADFLVKPFDIQTLLGKIELCVGQSGG